MEQLDRRVILQANYLNFVVAPMRRSDDDGNQIFRWKAWADEDPPPRPHTPTLEPGHWCLAGSHYCVIGL